MKSDLLYYLALLLLCHPAYAQDPVPAEASGGLLNEYMETGMEASGVRHPIYNPDGSLKVQLFGGQARILEGGVVDITNLRIDIYEEGAVVMTVFAPQCFTRVVEKEETTVVSVESEGDVLIEMEQMTISGRGFRFSSDNSRFEILSGSRVLVKEAARKFQELDP